MRERRIEAPLIAGIYTGGAWIAERLHTLLELTEPLSMLDISFYRDDFTRIGVNPQVRPSRLPVSIDDRHIVLVDDVLNTGRTIRAALNEIFDYGRPASIMLATLVERGGGNCRYRPTWSVCIEARQGAAHQIARSGAAQAEHRRGAAERLRARWTKPISSSTDRDACAIS